MGIKQLPHFENLLHTFAMQYKIKVQGNCETVVLLAKTEKYDKCNGDDRKRENINYREEAIPDCGYIYG